MDPIADGPALEMSGVVKDYSPRVRALDGLELRVERGEIFGLIGPNGAGKSTAIRIAATLLSPSSGEVRVWGLDALRMRAEVRRVISYLPEEAGAYENLSGEEYLRFMARFYPGDVERAVERGARIADLGERIRSRTKEYSRGMKRRLLIGRTLMMDARLYILDEPTSGLDVLHAHHVRRVIRERVAETGTAALVSSHNLLEVELLCDRVAILYGGRVVGAGAPRELIERRGGRNLEDVFMAMAGRAGGEPPAGAR
ncbi:MAG: ABC transporter ATP-binding protein [Thermoplasmatota archaeon]